MTKQSFHCTNSRWTLPALSLPKGTLGVGPQP